MKIVFFNMATQDKITHADYPVDQVRKPPFGKSKGSTMPTEVVAIFSLMKQGSVETKQVIVLESMDQRQSPGFCLFPDGDREAGKIVSIN